MGLISSIGPERSSATHTYAITSKGQGGGRHCHSLWKQGQGTVIMPEVWSLGGTPSDSSDGMQSETQIMVLDSGSASENRNRFN